MKHYEQYQTLRFERPEAGVLEILIGQEGKLAITDARGHPGLGAALHSLSPT